MRSLSISGTLLVVLGCTNRQEPGRSGGEPVSPLAAQRVTATVQREALRFVRLKTEHETLLTTPEHAFAVPRVGWVSAGRLAPGDWVVSERFGAVRLLSVRSESVTRAIPVFNLSLAASHAYFVGPERVLVHNTRCKPIPPESREAALEQALLERAEKNREIKALTETTPASPRIAQLRTQRDQLSHRISHWRRKRREEQGVKATSRDERARQSFELEHEASSEALKAVRKELAGLESQPPTSGAEKAVVATRKASLEKRAASLKLSCERTSRILGMLRELAELEKQTPALEAESQALEERKTALRASLAVERERKKALKFYHKKRIEPEWWEERTKYHRAQVRRLFRSAAYLADRERPPDRLELLEKELAELAQGSPSEDKDARVHHVTDQIETMKRLVELRRASASARVRRRHVQHARKQLIAQGRDTRDLETKIEQVELDLRAIRIESAQLRVKGHLLARLDATPWARASEPVDEARLREFERQLAENITGGSENDQQLADIERVLDAMDPSHADLQGAVLDEAQDVDETLRERDELMRQRSSPERAAGLQSSYDRLQQELGEERAAVDAALSVLGNEHTAVQSTQTGLGRGPHWEERLRAIQEEQRELRAQWHVSLQERLASARRKLQLLRSVERLHDEAIEVELGREIALLERELQMSD